MILWSFALLMLVGSLSCDAQNAKKQAAKAVAKANIEVYYFHFTRRCMTCNAVEAQAKKAVLDLYPTLVQSGKITFRSINLDEANSKTAAEKCAVEGQSLLVVSGSNRLDLTSQGFMYAVNNPEKLKAELKKTIDPLL